MTRVPRPALSLGQFPHSSFVRLCIGALVVVSACTNLGLKREQILRQADGTAIEKITGFAEPAVPPASGQMTAESISSSLRRILVRYHGLISFSKSETVSLLTVEQANVFASVLEKELPSLAPNQRIRFSFRDARKHNLNEMDVHVEGVYLVYYFNVLVGKPSLALNAGDPPFSEADLSELPGQKISYAVPAVVILRDPISGSREATEADLARALAQIEEQRASGTIPAEEAARLRGIAEQHPQVRAEAWRVYWEKRTTLKKAREQSLLDDAAYNTQLAKIERELAP